MIDEGYYSSAMDFWLEKAIRDIKWEYGDDVSVAEKHKDLLKFGRSEQVQTGTKTTIMTLPSGVYNETYVSDNLITTVSSSNASDTAANNRSDLIVEGHTIDGNGDFTFVTQPVALNGQNQVTLTTPLARATRAYNNDTANIAGNVYFYEDGTSTGGVPDTLSEVHLMIRAGEQQSEKASTTVSKNDYYIITELYADVLEKVSSTAEIDLERRLKGKVFRKFTDLSASNVSSTLRPTFPYIIVPPNSDLRMRALASSADTICSGGMIGTLAKIHGT